MATSSSSYLMANNTPIGFHQCVHEEKFIKQNSTNLKKA
jgi:hypothetical protein